MPPAAHGSVEGAAPAGRARRHDRRDRLRWAPPRRAGWPGSPPIRCGAPPLLLPQRSTRAGRRAPHRAGRRTGPRSPYLRPRRRRRETTPHARARARAPASRAPPGPAAPRKDVVRSRPRRRRTRRCRRIGRGRSRRRAGLRRAATRATRRRAVRVQTSASPPVRPSARELAPDPRRLFRLGRRRERDLRAEPVCGASEAEHALERMKADRRETGTAERSDRRRRTLEDEHAVGPDRDAHPVEVHERSVGRHVRNVGRRSDPIAEPLADRREPEVEERVCQASEQAPDRSGSRGLVLAGGHTPPDIRTSESLASNAMS